MAKYISGRSKLTPQTGLSSDRYRYLSVSESEPNLGDPLIGPSAYLDNLPPAGNQYIVIGVDGYPGERYWIPNQGGIIPGSITIFDENDQIGGLSSTTQLNFIGNSVVAEGIGGINPGFAVTITVKPPGNDNSVLFKNNGDFATDSRFTFDNGLFAAGDRITVGTGGTVITTTGIGSVGIRTANPTQELHLDGDFRITGTIYDSINQPGDQGELIVKGANGGLLWIRPNSIVSGAGGTIGQVQFHNTAGLVDGADNFYYDFNNNRVGIGSTIPTQLLDVLGVSTFSGGVFVDNLTVSGVSTFISLIDANGGIDATTLNVSGLSTFVSNVDMDAGLDVDGRTDLDVLNVSDTASFTSTTDNTLGNTNTGAVQVDGGVGIDKNLTVGQTIQATNLNITGVGTIPQFDFGTGEFDNIVVTGVSTLGNVVIGVNSISTKPGTGNLTIDSDGTSSVVIKDFILLQKDTESTSTNTGALQVDGGVGIDKSVNIGLGLNVGGATTLASNGGITTTGGDLYVNGDLFVTDDVVYDELSARRGVFTEYLETEDFYVTGVSTFVGGKVYIDTREIGISTFVNNKTEWDARNLNNSTHNTSSVISLSAASALVWNNEDVSGINTTLTITGWWDDNAYIDNRSANGSIIFRTGLTEPTSQAVIPDLIIDSSGNIGVGTDSASTKMQIAGDVTPSQDDEFDLGQPDLRWNNVYANTFNGTFQGVANSANNIAGGATGSLPYQSATDTTTFLAEPNATGKILSYSNTTNAPIWISESSIETTQSTAAATAAADAQTTADDAATAATAAATAAADAQTTADDAATAATSAGTAAAAAQTTANGAATAATSAATAAAAAQTTANGAATAATSAATAAAAAQTTANGAATAATSAATAAAAAQTTANGAATAATSAATAAAAAQTTADGNVSDVDVKVR